MIGHLSRASSPFNTENARRTRTSPFFRGLTNVDKHRFPHISGSLAKTVPITVSYGSEGEYAGRFPWHPRFVKDVRRILGVSYTPSATSDDRTELMRVLIEPWL